MTSSSKTTTGDGAKPTSSSTQAKKEDESSTQTKNPIDAAARRLERLLVGVGPVEPSTTFPNASVRLSLSNPGKIVRRWLGTSSGTASNAKMPDVISAGKRLLQPGAGLDLLTALEEEEGEDAKMTVVDEEKKEDSASSSPVEKNKLASARCEVESWLLSLAVRILWRAKKFTRAFELATKSISVISSHVESSTAGRDPAALFPLLARIYRYRSLVSIDLPNVYLRDDLVHAHSVACLRRDVDSQATLLNLILSDLLRCNQVEQAQKLLSNSTFPENASHNQLCRYLYNSGFIHALRLDYTSAFSSLSQSLRKAQSNIGLGFRIATQRLLVVVQLLMGEIPDRAIFFDPTMRIELEPYLKITQAVRRGDLAVFHSTVGAHAAQLKTDGTYTLISRLAHSVVKAGLRKLNVSYSRISLRDIAERLSLPSAQSAEYVVAKAVRDGVIDATINHEEGYVRSHENADIYATKEPAEAFHRRIAFCLTTHNDAVKGMKYPPDQYKRELEKSRGRNKNEGDKTDEEMAKELEEELDEDY